MSTGGNYDQLAGCFHIMSFFVEQAFLLGCFDVSCCSTAPAKTPRSRKPRDLGHPDYDDRKTKTDYENRYSELLYDQASSYNC